MESEVGGENRCDEYHPCNHLSGGDCCTVYSTPDTKLGALCCAYSTAGEDEIPSSVIRTPECYGTPVVP
jgi:ornithine carbamoyltransferase